MHGSSNDVCRYVEIDAIDASGIFILGRFLCWQVLFAFKVFCLLLPFHLPVVYTLHWGVRDVEEILTGVAPSRSAPWRSACAGGVASHQEGNYEIPIRLLRI